MTDLSPSGRPAPDLSLRKAIDAACDRLEDDWRQGSLRELDEYLGPAAAESRAAYFRELLALLLSLDPPADWLAAELTYAARFSEWHSIVAEVVDEERPADEADRSLRNVWPVVHEAQQALRAQRDNGRTDEIGSQELAAGGETSEAGQLWAAIVRRADGRSGDGAPPAVESVLAVVADMLQAFPVRRRRMLRDLLLFYQPACVATAFASTQRTLDKTIEAALSLLSQSDS